MVNYWSEYDYRRWIAQDFPVNTKIKFLCIPDCNLTSIPSKIENLPNLVQLIVNRNKLTGLPIEIGKLQSLKHLDLCGNEFTSMPDVIWSLPNIVYLRMDYNKLTALPVEIGKLQSLEYLNLCGNEITYTQDAIWNLRSLNIKKENLIV